MEDSQLLHTSPLSYNEWLKLRVSTIEESPEVAYINYLKEWYKKRNEIIDERPSSSRELFVRLLKDINFLFGEGKDPFLSNINYSNDSELITAIPFFAKKLTEICRYLNSKREYVKRSKNRYEQIGSTEGVENLLYEYVLRSFTKQENNLTQIPFKQLSTSLPELSSLRGSFYIEVEELHDPSNYFDSDPEVSISKYLDQASLKDFYPLTNEKGVGLSESEVLNIIASRFYPKVGESSLFKKFAEYLNQATNDFIDTEALSALNFNITNQIAASQKYLGESVYGLTALRIEDIIQPDDVLNLDIQQGNNWFLWPSGFYTTNNKTYNNYFEPIKLIDSSFVESGATGGTNLNDSDIIFSDKNGVVEGAWLRGSYIEEIKSKTDITLKGGEVTEFLYPYVGFSVNAKTLAFEDFSLSGRNTRIFDNLDKSVQDSLLTNYYTNTLPLSTSSPLYINQTSLTYSGATPGLYSDEADVIVKRPHNYTLKIKHSDLEDGDTEKAYAYKFTQTDIPITSYNNVLLWPLQSLKIQDSNTIHLNEQTCLPVKLNEINPSHVMMGATAGLTIDAADIIYKLASKDDTNKVLEAAWLSAPNMQGSLNVYKNEIAVYKKNFIKCADCLDGPIQTSLNFKVSAGERVSFVWMGPDTYADEVFHYTSHSKDCLYGKTYPHDYYVNQDYVNASTRTNTTHWTKCTCKATLYSPIGHSGEVFSDYNSSADYLYADPFALGDSFTLTDWKDTRGYDFRSSPQFAYFQLNKNGYDSPVGFGEGRWKNSSPSKYTVYIGDSFSSKFVVYHGLKEERLNVRVYETTSLKEITNFKFVYLSEDEIQVDLSSVKQEGVYMPSGAYYVEVESFNSRMVLKTGRLYTYCRSALRTGFNSVVNAEESRLPYYVVNRPYNFNISSSLPCVDQNPVDVVLAVDLSRSQSYSKEELINNVKNLIELLLNGRENNLQISIVAFNGETYNLTYLTSDVYSTILVLNSLEIPALYPDYTTNIYRALKLSNEILTKRLPEIDSAGVEIVLPKACENVNAYVRNAIPTKNYTNVPQENAKKVIVVLSDGEHNSEDFFTLSMARSLKEGGQDPGYPTEYLPGGVEIYGVNFGELSITNDVMRKISSSEDHYYNLHKYLNSGDGDYPSFATHLTRHITNCAPFYPVWKKAIKNTEGAWVATNEISDMVLRPGDYINYYHQPKSYIINKTKNINLEKDTVSFTINLKLDGWDYETHTFSPLNIGSEYGGMPFWGQIPLDPVPFAGYIRFVDDYLPVRQPLVSDIVIENSNFLQYYRVGSTDIKWSQPVTFNLTQPNYQWCKINFEKTYSNLAEFLRGDNTNVLITPSYDTSDILLESYSSYKAAYYHYVARQNFSYKQNLFNRNKCKTGYVQVVTGVSLEPLEPASNVLNRFYPTVANVSFPEKAVSEKEIGGYLLPENLGVPTFRGRGYEFEVDTNSLSAIDALSAERIFFDLNKYGPQNKGLTQKTQTTPVTLKSINNSWVVEPFGAGDKSGMMIGTLENQKFTPYQTEYEVTQQNNYGLSRQSDKINFWKFDGDKIKWNQEGDNLNYSNQIEQLLANKGIMVQWKNDLFGNDYGLYKQIEETAYETLSSISYIVKAKKFPPVVTYTSPSVLANLNERTTLSVEVSGTEPFSYQWYKNNYPITNGHSKLLIFNKLASEDEALYYCKISNLVGYTSSGKINLTVNQLPTILNQSSSLYINPGETATLFVVASSLTPLTYKWYRDGLEINGAETDTFSTSQSGTYVSKITNVVGSVNTKPIVLSKNEAVQIISTSPNVLEYLIEDLDNPGNFTSEIKVNLSVEAIGTRPLNVLWFLNGTPTEGGEELTSITAYTTGLYQCEVSNLVNKVTSDIISVSAEVIRHTPYFVYASATDVTIIDSQSATIQAQVTGSYPLDVKLYSGINYSVETFNKYVSSSANNVIEFPISVGGSFILEASNLVGSVTAGPFNVEKFYSPTFVKNLPANFDIVDDNFILSVSAVGSAPIVYNWYRNDQLLTSSGGVLNLKVSSSGTYKVIASNSVGFAESSACQVVNISEYLPKFTIQPQGSSIRIEGNCKGNKPYSERVSKYWKYVDYAQTYIKDYSGNYLTNYTTTPAPFTVFGSASCLDNSPITYTWYMLDPLEPAKRYKIPSKRGTVRNLQTNYVDIHLNPYYFSGLSLRKFYDDANVIPNSRNAPLQLVLNAKNKYGSTDSVVASISMQVPLKVLVAPNIAWEVNDIYYRDTINDTSISLNPFPFDTIFGKKPNSEQSNNKTEILTVNNIRTHGDVFFPNGTVLSNKPFKTYTQSWDIVDLNYEKKYNSWGVYKVRDLILNGLPEYMDIPYAHEPIDIKKIELSNFSTYWEYFTKLWKEACVTMYVACDNPNQIEFSGEYRAVDAFERKSIIPEEKMRKVKYDVINYNHFKLGDILPAYYTSREYHEKNELIEYYQSKGGIKNPVRIVDSLNYYPKSSNNNSLVKNIDDRNTDEFDMGLRGVGNNTLIINFNIKGPDVRYNLARSDGTLGVSKSNYIFKINLTDLSALFRIKAAYLTDTNYRG